jgi:hypothetical protein
VLRAPARLATLAGTAPHRDWPTDGLPRGHELSVEPVPNDTF